MTCLDSRSARYASQPAWLPDNAYPPGFSILNPPSPPPYNVGLDYHGDTPWGGGWITVTVSDHPDGGAPSQQSAVYYDIVGGGFPGVPPSDIVIGSQTAFDPDVVVIGRSPAQAVVVYYEMVGSTAQIGIGYEPNITSPGNALSPIIGLILPPPFPVATGFTPVVNIDANQYDDWVITYSTSLTTAYFAMGNGLSGLMALRPTSWHPLTGAINGQYIQPDVAISDMPGGSAYAVALDNYQSEYEVYRLNGGGTCANIYNYSTDCNMPRIACPPSGSNQTTDWASVVEMYGGVHLFYGSGSSFYTNSLTNGVTPLGSPGTPGALRAAIGSNLLPVISYNKDGCGTISTNWYNSTWGGIIGLEIESGAGFTMPFNTLRDLYGLNQFMAISNLATDEPSAVCGRYADTKAAAFDDGSSMYHHHIDCIGSWRLKKPVITSPTAATSKFSIYPNPAADAVSLTIDADKVSGSSTIVIENLLGQRVLETAINASVSSQQINISTLPAGMYNLKVVDGGQLVYTTKVVKE